MAIRLSSSRQGYVPSNRYINWIDEHWHESIGFANHAIPESKIEDVKKLLKEQFIYYAEFIHADGTTEEWSAFKKVEKKNKIKFKIGKTFSFVIKK
jgi:hypothetical protein